MSETTLRANRPRRPWALHRQQADPSVEPRTTAPESSDSPETSGSTPGSTPESIPEHGSGEPRGGLRRLAFGPADQARWVRPLFWLLIAATAALYLIDLTNSGYANDFYSAAVKSGTESVKAWFFGSLDSANSITVDKPPASLWLMVASARLFGFSSFSLLLPQALLGIGTVALVHGAVKRWYGPAAGLIAGLCLALTPVAALMFRFDNPDALLVFLMTAAAYAVVRALDLNRVASARRGAAFGWMALAGTAIGFAFLTKLGQGLLVLPAFVIVYLVCSRARIVPRLLHLLTAAVAMVVSGGWFVAVVELWPAASRPYIGGSTNNSLWELAVGYNGLSRLLGGSGNGGGGGGGGGNVSFGGATGITRMFGSSFGIEISWLLPAALIFIVSSLIIGRRAGRTDLRRAGVLLWGGWLIVTALVFSFMSGTIHPYYAIALAPAIAALVGIGGTRLWAARDRLWARIVLGATMALTAGWGTYLMITYASGWLTWLAWAMLAGGVLGGVLLVVSAGRLKKLAVAAVLIGSLSALAGTTSFTLATVSRGHTGSIPTSGPSVVSTNSGFGGGGPGGGTRGGFGGGPGQTGTNGTGQGGPGGQTGQQGQPPSQTGGSQTGGTQTGNPQTTTGGTGSSTQSGTSRTQGGGGFGGGSSANSEVTALLEATTTTWSAATIGSQSAAGYILNTDTAVMAIGGFSGTDDSPTLAQFQAYVKDGKISYFIAGGQGGGGRGGSTSSASAITSWVEANYTAKTVGGVTVYDLTS